ncbi:MAG: DUF3135 domain-containing protein [Gammaproteobacteria bacterium]|nr:DUF3135 domain-containing protein [Gammaproteobacteria bacterium]
MELPDFDHLMSLADNNPDELENLRKFFCDELISNAPERYQKRLRGLQFQVDMIRRKSKNPLQSCILISRLMLDNCYNMQQAIRSLSHPDDYDYPEAICYKDNVIYL